MKHLDPQTDFDIHDREQARLERKSVYRLTLNDLIKTPVEVHGIRLDATVDANFTKRNGEIELDGIEIGDVYIWCPTISGNLIKLDQTSLKNTHSVLYEDFVATVQALALTKATDGPWEFDEVDDE
jgi:hypothetical protein